MSSGYARVLTLERRSGVSRDSETFFRSNEILLNNISQIENEISIVLAARCPRVKVNTLTGRGKRR